MFDSSYKTFSNFGNKMPDNIKRLQNDYIKNNGGEVQEGAYHQTDRYHPRSKAASIGVLRSRQVSQQTGWPAQGPEIQKGTTSLHGKEFFTPAHGNPKADLNALGTTVNNKSLEELLKGSSIEPASQKPYVELLTGSKKVKIGSN